MQIYYFKAQGPWRVCAAAKYLGIEAEFIKLDAAKREHKTDEYLALNPNGKAPLLVDGDYVLWESPAICAYLSNKAGADLWPSTNGAEQVEVLRWTNWDGWQWSRVVGDFYVQNHIKKIYGLGDPDLELLAKRTPAFHEHARILNAGLEGKTFLVGDRLTVADICVGSMLPGWDEMGMPLHDYANIRRWYDAMMDIPAWRDPWPEA